MADTYDTAAEAAADREQHEQHTTDHAISIEVVSYPLESSPRYRVMYRGEELIASSRVPILDACRVLVAKGLSGSIGLYRGGQLDALVRDIAVGAQYTIRESAEVSLTLTKYVPYDTVSARTAEKPSTVGGPTPEQDADFRRNIPCRSA